MSYSMRRNILSLAIITVVVCAIRLPLLSIPLERDEGEYAYIAWRLDEGELPYRDWIDQKPPAIFWAYRLALDLPIDPIKAVHLMGLLWSIASAGALYLLAGRFLKQVWAVGAALLFALLSGSPMIEGTAANTELFMLLPLILAQIAFFKAADDRRNFWWMILAGALTGMAAAFKQVGAVNWFFLIALYPLFTTAKRRVRATLFFVLWSGLGVAVVWGYITGYFYVRHGLGPFIYNVFTHNLEYINTISRDQRLENFRTGLALLQPAQLAAWILAAAGLVALAVTKRIKLLLFMAGWLVTSLIGTSASGYFFPHYFQQMLPVLAVAAALGAEAVDDLRSWKNLPAWLRQTLLGGLMIVSPVMVIWPFLFSYSPVQAVKKIYPGDVLAEMQVAGKRIAQITGPNDRVYIFGAEPEVLFYAQRVSATRYIFLFPLYGPYRDARLNQMVTADEITRNQPAAALWLPSSYFFAPGTEHYLTDWTHSYLWDHFQVDACLTTDAARNYNFIFSVPNQTTAIPAGQQSMGIIFLKPANDQGSVKSR